MSFSSFTKVDNALLSNRLDRIQAQVRALRYSTREEYIVALTSLVNAVLGINYAMQPLKAITPETPAVVGDVIANFASLNQDAIDIAAELERLEDDASVLYNLTAAMQNSIRQKIREQIYQNSITRFVEEFINSSDIASSTATIDYNAGVAQLALINEVFQAPVITIGSNAVGSSPSNISALADGNVETIFLWTGNLLELIINFPAATICNRLTLSPEGYKGYEITSFTSSPDGSIYEDILQDIGVDGIVMNGTSGKFSGSMIVDFPPKSVRSMRLVIENRVDNTGIGLRDLALSQRSYQASAVITSSAQTSPAGQVLFELDEQVFAPYVSVSVQISSNGVHYTTIQPGLVTLPPNWWYRILLARSSSAFSTNSTPVLPTTSDPQYSSGFTLSSSSSVPLSPNTVERTLVLTNVSGPVPLRDTPISGTIQASVGNLYLTASQFSLSAENVLTFSQAYPSLTLTYQTAAQGSQDISSLQQYYTPLVYGIRFIKQ